MVSVKPRSWDGGDEELAAVRAVHAAVRTGVDACVSHGEQVGAVELHVADFVVEDVTGAAGAIAGRITALNHEVLDDAVERRVVVQRVIAGFTRLGVAPLLAAFGESDEILDGEGCFVFEQVDGDVALRRMNDCLCHSRIIPTAVARHATDGRRSLNIRRVARSPVGAVCACAHHTRPTRKLNIKPRTAQLRVGFGTAHCAGAGKVHVS